MWEKVNKDEKGVWNEYVNTLTGESSIKEHKPKVVWKSCKKFEAHNFEVTGNREWTCTKCNFKFIPIIGIHKLENGKIIETLPPLKK
jgi:hypothetical protein